MIVDLTDLTFADPSLMIDLACLAQRLRANGVTLWLAHPQPNIRTLIETDAEAKTVFDTALGLENLKRQWGVHAAGVIISSERPGTRPRPIRRR